MANEDLKERIEELEAKVAELERYVEQKKVQQITFPLDTASATIIDNL